MQASGNDRVIDAVRLCLLNPSAQTCSSAWGSQGFSFAAFRLAKAVCSSKSFSCVRSSLPGARATHACEEPPQGHPSRREPQELVEQHNVWLSCFAYLCFVAFCVILPSSLRAHSRCLRCCSLHVAHLPLYLLKLGKSCGQMTENQQF